MVQAPHHNYVVRYADFHKHVWMSRTVKLERGYIHELYVSLTESLLWRTGHSIEENEQNESRKCVLSPLSIGRVNWQQKWKTIIKRKKKKIHNLSLVTGSGLIFIDQVILMRCCLKFQAKEIRPVFGMKEALSCGSVWVTCLSGLTLGNHAVVVQALGTHTEEGAIHVQTLGLSTHTAQQLTLICICGRTHTHTHGGFDEESELKNVSV